MFESAFKALVEFNSKMQKFLRPYVHKAFGISFVPNCSRKKFRRNK